MQGLTKNIFLFSILLFIYSLAWIIQLNIILNWDVCWDLIGTERFLNGGTYTKDFFDLNPPLIFYHLMPVILLTKIFPITISQSLILYLLAISVPLLLINAVLLKKIFQRRDTFLVSIAVLLIAIIYTIFPFYNFGQREHFLVLLSLPYFLLVACRAEGCSIKNSYALAIGLIAASGFALKPYFLIAPLMVEFYFLCQSRQWLAWIRPETIAIISFFLGYLFFVAYFYPDYISTVLPATLRYYHQGFRQSWTTVIFHPLPLMACIALIFYSWQYKNNRHRAITSILALAILGFLLSYYAQRTTWVYHAYPAYTLSILLSFLLLFSLLSRPHRKAGLLYLFGSLFIIYPVYHALCLYDYAMTYKNDHQPLVNFLEKTVNHQSVYLLSASGHNLLPAAYYAHSQFASRYMHLFWVPGYVASQGEINNPNLTLRQTQDEAFLISAVADDLNRKKPKFIFVDAQEYKNFFKLIPFDFIQYLSKNSKFIDAWKPYQYLTTIESLPSKPGNLAMWKLYSVSNLNEINPLSTPDSAVCLVGNKNPFTVYFVDEHKFITKDNQQFLNAHVSLNDQELKLITSHRGYIPTQAHNAFLIHTIINRSVNYPIYKFDVYQRQDNKETIHASA